MRDVAAIILDEAHERSVNLDSLIGLLRTGQCDDRWPHLKIIVTSATIDTQLFSKYLSNPETNEPAPNLSIPGRMFPVQVIYRPYNSNGLLGGGEHGHINASVRLAIDIHRDTPITSGDILVFLTGSDEVENAVETFTKAAAHLKGAAKPTLVLPLYGRQQPEEQEAIFAKTPKGTRKVVFSTDVAETGVTIDGICHVVDTGIAKEMVFDEQRKVSVLETRPISRSSAEQRKGRAGRTAPDIVHCDECNIKYCVPCSKRHGVPISQHEGYTCTEADLLLDVGVEDHYHRITRDVLPCKCPQCKNHFYDFDGCFNVTCTYGMCNAAICGCCLQLRGVNGHSYGASDCPLSSNYSNFIVPPGETFFPLYNVNVNGSSSRIYSKYSGYRCPKKCH